VKNIRESSILEMTPGQHAQWNARADGQLTVQEGQAWITRPGDLRDYWVRGGESFAVRQGESLWIGAEGAPVRALVQFD